MHATPSPKHPLYIILTTIQTIFPARSTFFPPLLTASDSFFPPFDIDIFFPHHVGTIPGGPHAPIYFILTSLTASSPNQAGLARPQHPTRQTLHPSFLQGPPSASVELELLSWPRRRPLSRSLALGGLYSSPARLDRYQINIQQSSLLEPEGSGQVAHQSKRCTLCPGELLAACGPTHQLQKELALRQG